MVIPGPWSKCQCFYSDLRSSECFSVTQEDLLTEDDVIRFFDLVEKADHKEVSSFLEHQCFDLDLSHNSSNTVDAIWVRRWVGDTIKSRCCGRGFLDVQRQEIDRHSSTASILSHRLGMCLAAQYNWSACALDVSTAFLRGLRFTEIEARAAELGVEVRKSRTVWLRPPGNFWRHLRRLGWCTVEDHDRALFLLRLLKAIYGLVDGPLLFQMAFLHYLVTVVGFHSSLHDENFLYTYGPIDDKPTNLTIDTQRAEDQHDDIYNITRHDRRTTSVQPSTGWVLLCIIVLHVDDLLVLAPMWVIEWVVVMIERRFGKLKINHLPFTWCGIRHELLSPGHFLLHQQEYAERMQPAIPTQKLCDNKELCDSDHAAFRSIVMCLLWLCRTRNDLHFEVVSLQTHMQHPLGIHLKWANNVLKFAKSNVSMLGLHFCNVGPKARLAQITDSGHINAHSAYPQEGRIVLLLPDCNELRHGTAEYIYSHDAAQLGGRSCSLFCSSKKAQRVSYSTSHSETNPAVNCSAISNMIASRFSELEFCVTHGRYPAVKDLLEQYLTAQNTIPIDLYTDAMNLWELVCSARTLPSDKNHRIGILSLREDRITRRLRHIIHVPTGIMLADQLTKKMLSPIFMKFVSSGIWATALTGDQRARIRRAARRSSYTERDLIENRFPSADSSPGVGDPITSNNDMLYLLALYSGTVAIKKSIGR